MFKEALFAITKNWDQENVHQQKWVSTWWYAHAREQNPTMKKEEAIDKHNMKACQNNCAERKLAGQQQSTY